MWLRQCRVPVKCCRTGGWIRPTILFYRDSLQYFFVSSIYIFGRVILKMVNFCISWSILSWLSIEILRYLKCDCANVECRLNAVEILSWFFAVFFVSESSIYIWPGRWWIFYISWSILSWLPIEILRYLKCDCANVECRLNAVVILSWLFAVLFVSESSIYIWPSDLEDGEFFYFVIFIFIVIANRNLAGS